MVKDRADRGAQAFMDDDRRYQVFISSPYKELKEHRKALIYRLLQLQYIPAGMELFSAGDKGEFEVIKSAIDQSDIYVLLLGAQYGSTLRVGRERKSFTQVEYEYATGVAKKPAIVFVLRDEEFDAERLKLATADHEDKQFDTHLRAFRKQAMSGRIVDFFSLDSGSITQLELRLDKALSDLMRDPSCRLSGYIRGDRYTELMEDARLIRPVGDVQIMREIVEGLNEYRSLAERMNSETAPFKMQMADFFWELFGGDIFLSGVRELFFDAGSSNVFLAHALLQRLKAKRFGAHFEDSPDSRQRLRIMTCNIPVLLQFQLFSGIRVRLVPHGPPDPRFGSTTGDFGLLIAPSPPPLGPDELLREHAEVVSCVVRDAFKRGEGERIMLFMGAARLELSDKATHQGPAVEQYPNMLIKRAMFESKHPVFIFVDETKIGARQQEPHLHPVCTPSLPWSRVCQEQPLGICIVTSTSVAHAQVTASLAKNGLHSVLAVAPSRRPGCFTDLLVNGALRECIPIWSHGEQRARGRATKRVKRVSAVG